MTYSNPPSHEGEFRYGIHTPLNTRYGRTRPAGVTVLAVLNFISAGLQVLALLLVILVPPEPVQPLDIGDDPTGFGVSIQRILEEQRETQRTVTACMALLVAPLSVILGLGLWKLRPWARKWSLVLYGLGAILTLLGSYSRPLTGSSLITILVSGIAFVYLLRPEIAEAFTERPDV